MSSQTYFYLSKGDTIFDIIQSKALPTWQDLCATDSSFTAALEKAKLFSALKSCLVISGERSAGRATLAKAIANAANIHNPSIAKCVTFDALAEEQIIITDKSDQQQVSHRQKTILTAHEIATAYKEAKPLLESFTSALHEATGATLIVRNLERLPLYLQSKILSIINRPTTILAQQELEIEQPRIILICTGSLDQRVRDGSIHPDLASTLENFEIKVPSLRETPIRLRQLAETFIKQSAQEHRLSISFSESALTSLSNHHWSGNLNSLFSTLAALIEYAVQTANSKITSEIVDTFIKDAKHSSPTNRQPLEPQDLNSLKVGTSPIAKKQLRTETAPDLKQDSAGKYLNSAQIVDDLLKITQATLTSDLNTHIASFGVTKVSAQIALLALLNASNSARVAAFNLEISTESFKQLFINAFETVEQQEIDKIINATTKNLPLISNKVLLNALKMLNRAK